MWGQKAKNSAINFEWPPQTVLSQQIAPDVGIKSFLFKSSSYYFSSVQVTLTNGLVSPVFERGKPTIHHSEQTVTLDRENDPIKAVSMIDYGDELWYIRFIDKLGKVVAKYDPYSR